MRLAYDGPPVLVAGKMDSPSSSEAPLPIRWVQGAVARRGDNDDFELQGRLQFDDKQGTRRVLYIDWGVCGISGKDSSLSSLEFGARLMVWLGILRIGYNGDKISLPLFDLRLSCEGRNLALGWGVLALHEASVV
jgi:hypothetical protein